MPATYNELANGTPSLLPAVQYYADFVAFLLGSKWVLLGFLKYCIVLVLRKHFGSLNEIDIFLILSNEFVSAGISTLTFLSSSWSAFTNFKTLKLRDYIFFWKTFFVVMVSLTVVIVWCFYLNCVRLKFIIGLKGMFEGVLWQPVIEFCYIATYSLNHLGLSN